MYAPVLAKRKINRCVIFDQAMDQSHVALVSLKLEDVGFLHYRCDRPRSLGLNMSSVVKVFKLCGGQDTVAIQSEDDGEMITFVFENNGRLSSRVGLTKILSLQLGSYPRLCVSALFTVLLSPSVSNGSVNACLLLCSQPRRRLRRSVCALWVSSKNLWVFRRKNQATL